MGKLNQTSFKTNVLTQIIKGARVFQDVFIDYEYEIFSNAFKKQKTYIISASKTNFLHLTGVNTSLSAEDFFNKALNKTLTESDFDFVKKNQSEKSVKGSVRRKVKFLSDLDKIFMNNPLAQESLVKNRISCSLATSENTFTIGFIACPKCRPNTLLKGNELINPCKIERIAKRKRGDASFSDVIFEINIQN